MLLQKFVCTSWYSVRKCINKFGCHAGSDVAYTHLVTELIVKFDMHINNCINNSSLNILGIFNYFYQPANQSQTRTYLSRILWEITNYLGLIMSNNMRNI